jgi:hypothetical protein
MDKIDIDKYKRFWVTKYITEPDENGYIFKYFKNDWEHNPYPFEKQSDIIKKKEQYIWRFIPETELIKDVDGSYYIKQKYIEWRLLKFVDINQLDKKVLCDLLELFNWYIDFCKNEWIQIDVFGYQEDIYHIENIRKKRFLFYTRMLDSFLSSTNIMISDDNKVYMVDVCDTIPVQNQDQRLYKIKHAARQAIIKLWIKRTEFKIRRVIEKKREELFDALS